MRIIFLLPLLLAGAFALWGCVIESQATPAPEATPPPDVKVTVDAAVSATLSATSAKTVGETPATPETTRQRPTVTNAPPSTPFPTKRSEPTPRPTLVPVNTPAKRAESIFTSLGQQVDATVTGFNDSLLRFDQLITAINEGERLLGVPYPSPIVTMRRVTEVSGGFCGSYAPRYAGDPYAVDGSVISVISVRIDEDCDETFAIIAHEVAHTWFHGSDAANWIDEGLSNVVEFQVVANNQDVHTNYPQVTYCESYRNISELERGNPARINKDPYTGFGCNYTLGDGIFGALREHYADTEFNKRIAQLARRETNKTIREQTIADIRSVLGGDGKALDVVNLWYDGQPEMRKYRHLDAVKWTHPPTVDGGYLYFSGTIGQPGVVHDFVQGDDPYCSQFVLYEGVGNQKWVASVSRPLPAGWTHDEDAKVVTVNHHISPATGEFSVTAKILGNSLAGVSGMSLSVRERVTTGAGGKCNQGTIYSQGPIVLGKIPSELKKSRHYHLDGIQWTDPPTVAGNTLKFAGKALPGAVRLTWEQGYCGQFLFYERDERGYHYIDSIKPFLPTNRSWAGPVAAEVVERRENTDGAFEALVNLSDNVLVGYRNPVLVVTTLAAMDSATNRCGKAKVLSAVDIR